MSNEEQIADTIEMLYKRLNEYHKQDLFNYGYLLESNQILCKDIEEKDKEIERLNNIINELEKWLEEKDEEYQPYYSSYDYNGEYEDCLDKLKELKGEKNEK